jgi:hypothetical protein
MIYEIILSLVALFLMFNAMLYFKMAHVFQELQRKSFDDAWEFHRAILQLKTHCCKEKDVN